MVKRMSPKKVEEVLDILIGEVALSRRKIETLIELLDEKGLLTDEEFRNKLKEVSEAEKLEMLISITKK